MARSSAPPTRRARALKAALALLAATAGAFYVVAPGPLGPDAPPAPAAEAPSRPTKIDVHVHVGPRQMGEAIEIMNKNGIALALNASGGSPRSIEGAVAASRRHGSRIRFYCRLSLRGLDEPGFAASAIAALERCQALGGVGWKIGKSLGLGYLREDGGLLGVDDPRLDPVFERAGALSLPVLIHSGDPQAFFTPPAADNERFAELSAHPGWSFFGPRPDGLGPWPTWETVFAQYERRVARHPGTRFIGAHFGNAPEEPERVAEMLRRYPNLFIETGARVPEIGRHPAQTMRRFFERFEDRILFGTDLAVTPSGLILGSSGEDPDPPSRVGPFFAAHWRYFETRDRGMAHPTPIQGDWTIDGIGLDGRVLAKLYSGNAERLFRLGTRTR